MKNKMFNAKIFFDTYIKNFEDIFWKNDFQYIKSREAKKSISNILLKRFLTVYEPLFDKLYVEELGKINPFFELDPGLADRNAVTTASNNTIGRLYNNPSLMSFDLLQKTVEDFLCFTKDFFCDFERNKSQIEKTLFDSQTINEIVGFSAITCSAHNNGRFILIIATDVGEFVYKKHDCRNDVWIRKFLNRYFDKQVSVPKCLADSNLCGFCEYIKGQKPSQDEIETYYYNLGILASVSRSLGMSDLHSDNIIPCGSIPVIIDNEMIFQPLTSNTVDEFLYGRFQDRGYSYYLNRSIIGQGVIEYPFSPIRINTGLDYDERMQDFFVRGFSYGYDIISENRDALINEIQTTKDFTIRKNIRLAIYYKAWIRKMYTDKSNAYLHSISNSSFPNASLVCKYEMSVLRQGNYPYFGTLASSTDLYDGDGKIIINNFFDKSSIDMAYERLSIMSEENKLFEIALIKAYFRIDSGDLKSDEEFISYWENKLIQAPNKEYFWVNNQMGMKSPDLPPDTETGSLSIAKRCVQIVSTCNDPVLKQKAAKFIEIALFSFERILYGDLSSINKDKLMKGFETVKYIDSYFHDDSTARIIKKLEAFYGGFR